MPAATVKVEPPKVKKTVRKALDYTFALGRRKTAIARVRLYQHKGDNLINGKSVSAYFPSKTDQQLIMGPLNLTSTTEKFFFTVKVKGSGIKAQRDAVIHSLSRVLAHLDADVYRPTLKKAGLLTRDSRMKESRKVGTGGKARRRKQSPKR